MTETKTNNIVRIDKDKAIEICTIIATEICDEDINLDGGKIEKEIITSIKGRQITVKVIVER